MRILFKKGKQRALIKNFKNKYSLTWNQLTAFLNLKEGKLKAYYYETSLIPETIYLKLDKNKKFGGFIIEKRNENWGKSKGGKLSKGNTKNIRFPPKSKKFAEFYGIMLGDGNLTKIRDYKIGTYLIRIVGDANKDKKYLLNYVKPLIEKLFNIKVRTSKFKDTNAMYIEAHSKKLVKFLEDNEFKSGNKIKNQIGIPGWIKKNPSFLKVCIKGLYDTDGCAYKLTNQNSYQIAFSNRNRRLLNEVREELISLGIHPSKIIGEKQINITKKSELRKFLKLISFHNAKHLNKVKMWNLAL